MTLNIQLITMMTMIIGGFYLGMAHDTFRRFTPYWKKNTILVYFMEISFWLSQTAILFFLLYKANAGELRLYIFAACLLGFSMYQVIAAKLYKRILEVVIRFVIVIYRGCRKIVQALLITPIKWIVSFLLMTLLWIGQTTFKVLIIVLLPIKWILQFIYRMLPEKIKIIIRKCAGVYSIVENIWYKLKKCIPSKRR